MGQPFFQECIWLFMCHLYWTFLDLIACDYTLYGYLITKNELGVPKIWQPRHDDVNPRQIATITSCEMAHGQNKCCCFCSHQNRCCHSSWHFAGLNSCTHNDVVATPVAKNWPLCGRVGRQWWEENPGKSSRVIQRIQGDPEDHYSQQGKAHAFHC